MNKNTLIVLALILVAAAMSIVVLLMPVAPPPEPAPQAKAENKEKTRAQSSDFNFVDTTPASASSSSAMPQMAGEPNQSQSPMTPKETTLATIHDAMTTWSAEGVPVLEPLLANSDPEIRQAAMESMKQLGVPEAATALRRAAAKTTNPAEKQALLEAAEWAALPPAIGPESEAR